MLPFGNFNPLSNLSFKYWQEIYRIESKLAFRCICNLGGLLIRIRTPPSDPMAWLRGLAGRGRFLETILVIFRRTLYEDKGKYWNCKANILGIFLFEINVFCQLLLLLNLSIQKQMPHFCYNWLLKYFSFVSRFSEKDKTKFPLPFRYVCEYIISYGHVRVKSIFPLAFEFYNLQFYKTGLKNSCLVMFIFQ